MIIWSIEAAQASGCFDRIIVSTDDAEIADVASAAGAEIPFTRPAELSNDHAGTVPVVAHATGWALDNGMEASEICCIYATAPFIQASDIRHGLEIIIREGSDYVFPVATYPAAIQRAIKIKADGTAEMFNPELYATRSQDLEAAYHDAGQFYWGSSEAWLTEKPIFSPGAIPFVVPRYRVQDIDTEEDWRYAEIMVDVLSRAGRSD